MHGQIRVPWSSARVNMGYLLLENVTVLGLIILKDVQTNPNGKVHGANMGPIWGRQDPGGPHADPANFVTWVKGKTTCF